MKKRIRKIKATITTILMIVAALWFLVNKFDLLPQDIRDNVQSLVTEFTTSKPLENGLVEVPLIDVVDGDTVKVMYNGEKETVRFIGIDTPESVNPDESKNTEYGVMASDYTKELLKNTQKVYLQFDTEERDRYGRLLAYIWLTPDTSDIHNMLNYIVISDGYAYHLEVKPNTYYSKDFIAASENAKLNNQGLWENGIFAGQWN